MAGIERNPFVGPRPLRRGEKLHGRDRETRELFHLLKARRVVLLYSPSGAGKSSLVYAGLSPRLRRERFDVWRAIRLHLDPVALTGRESVANRYVTSTILSLEEGVPANLRRPADALAGLSLAEYLEGRPRRPGAPGNVVLIFDQFEEVLTVDPLAYEAKSGFFRQLGEALRHPWCWALFAIREDYLAALRTYREYLPTKLGNTYRIDRLDKESARTAMAKTAESGGRAFPAAEELAEDLATVTVQQADGSFAEQAGRFVEPVHLQVVCHRLWEEMPADDLSIDSADIRQYGGVDDSLEAYYSMSVATAAAGDPGSERLIREWVTDHLITKVGVRRPVLKGESESEGLPNELVDRLRGTHVLRAEQRAGATWYELAHDRLIDPARNSNEAWLESHLSELERRTALWVRQGRPPGLLLSAEELKEAAPWASANEERLGDEERRLLRESLQAWSREQKLRRLRAMAAVLSTIALVVAFVAMGLWSSAVEERKRAENMARAAITRDLLRSSETPQGGLLALEIRRPAETPGASLSLGEAARSPFGLAVLEGHEKQVLAANFSADGARVVTASDDSTARLWDAETGEPLAILRGHGGLVLAAAFCADDSRVVTVSDDSDVRLWDAGTGGLLAELKDHRGPVHSVSVHAGGARVVTTSSDFTARLWDARTGERQRVLEGHTALVYLASFSADGARVVSASADTTARVWDAGTGKELIPALEGHEGSVLDASFSPDGTRVVTASDDETARIWDAEKGGELVTLEGHEGTVYRASFSADGTRVVTASDDFTARVWDAKKGRELVSLVGHEGSVYRASFSPSGARVLTASWDSTARLWDAATGAELAVLEGHGGPVLDAVFSLDGSRVVTTSTDSTARLWDVDTGDELAVMARHRNALRAASFDGEGTRVVTASDDKTARLWDAPSGRALAVLEGHGDRLLTAAFSGDGTQVVTASWDRTGRTWDATTGRELAELEGHGLLVRSASFSADGTRVVTASADGTARLWSTASGECLAVFRGHEKALYGASFSDDGTRVVTASSDATARLWDGTTRQPREAGEEAETRTELVVLEGHDDRVWAAAFSADGTLVVTASWDKTARLWDVETGEELVVLVGHTDKLRAASFSPDGARVVTASEDGTARLWETGEGRELARLSEHEGKVNAASFSPDGTRVVTVSGDSTARLWDAETGEELAVLVGHGGSVLDASFSQDGSRVVTASVDSTARIWANPPDYPRYLQSRLRARNRLCLDPEFRQATLGEGEEPAMLAAALCERCVPVFFDVLDDAPRSKWEKYAEAWNAYEGCMGW